jgi:hypothetical protein
LDKSWPSLRWCGGVTNSDQEPEGTDGMKSKTNLKAGTEATKHPAKVNRTLRETLTAGGGCMSKA